MNLFGLTEHESGMLIAEGRVVCCNWGSFEDDCLPVVTPFGTVIGWHFGGSLDGAEMVTDSDTIDYIYSVIDDADNYDYADADHDIGAECPREDIKVWRLKNDALVVTWIMWN